MPNNVEPMIKGANFSCCGRYRFSLTRTWAPSKPTMVIIGLNPSTADEILDDPTIRRCIGFARREGFGSLIMLNLFAYRATNPKELQGKNYTQLSGNAENHRIVMETCKNVVAHGGVIVCAWGTHGTLLDTNTFFLEQILDGPLYCLGKTKDGHPRHPLYVKADKKFEIYP